MWESILKNTNGKRIPERGEISTKRRIGQSAASTGAPDHAGSARSQDTGEDHRSPPSWILRSEAGGDAAGKTEWLPTEPFNWFVAYRSWRGINEFR